MGPPLIFSTGWNTLYLVNEIKKESNGKPRAQCNLFHKKGPAKPPAINEYAINEV